MARYFASIDIPDDIIKSGLLPNQRHLTALFSYLKSLAVRRVEWIVSDYLNADLTRELGFDLTTATVESAHREGIELHAVYKPFDGAMGGCYVLPHDAPVPDGVPVWRDERGILPTVEPFVAAHPEYSLALRPGLVDAGRTLSAIRVSLEGDAPPRICEPGAFSIWTGTGNGSFTRYEGPWSAAVHSEQIATPQGRRRVCLLTISGLKLDPAEAFVEVRNEQAGNLALRHRSAGQTIELVDDRGSVIPSTPATPTAAAAPFRGWLGVWRKAPVFQELFAWSKTTEAREYLADDACWANMQTHTRLYDRFWEIDGLSSPLPEGAAFGAVRGKLRHLPGILNPLLPDVRQHWLQRIEQLIACGVDGVNIRPTHHLHPTDYRDYGFAPIEAAHAGEWADWPETMAQFGDGFTQFLREARDLLHRHGRTLGVHLMGSDWFSRLPESAVWTNVPPGIGRQWRTWIEEIADYAEYRAGVGNDPQAMRDIVDPFANVCRDGGVPLIYQGNPGLLRRPGIDTDAESAGKREARLAALAGEIRLVQQRPAIEAYMLYETAAFVTLLPDGGITGSPEVESVLAGQSA